MNFFGSLVSTLGFGSSTPIPKFDFNFKLDGEDSSLVSFTGAGGLQWTMRNGTRVGDIPSSSPASAASPGTAAAAAGSGGAPSAATGDSDDDGRGVTVFCCSSGSNALALNAMKRARSLVALPGVLKTLGVAEHDGKIWIATERCVPLRQVVKDPNSFYSSGGKAAGPALLDDHNNDDDEKGGNDQVDDDTRFEVAVALGLRSVATALSGMHRNALFHGNVGLDSVFVLQSSGEWRLFGFETVCPAADIASGSSSYGRDAASSLLQPHRVAPEFGGLGGAGAGAAGGGAVAAQAVPLADAWCLGMLMLEAFSAARNVPPPKVAADLRAPRAMPRNFLATYNSLIAPNGRARWSVDKFLAESELLHGGGVSRAVDLLGQLDELNLKNASERDTFYRELGHCVHHLPDRLAHGLVMPKISSLLQYGGSSAAALAPLLRIARRLPTHEAFAAKVSPAVLTLFSNTDNVVVRMSLLECAASYAPMLPPRLVCDKIWPLYAQGLVSKLPEVREQSVRALPHFAPVLAERFESGDVTRSLLALQQDAQGAIRANATICLAMVAKHIPAADNNRAKVLCNGLGRMLKDPYVPSRLAAVRALGSLVKNGCGGAREEGRLFPAQMLCEMLLPAVCPMLVDPDSTVREVATDTAQVMMREAIAAAQQVPCTATHPQSTATAPSSSQHGGSASSSAGTTPAGHSASARSPVVPPPSSTERPLVFGAGKPHSTAATAAASATPKPVVISAPASATKAKFEDPIASDEDDDDSWIPPPPSSAAAKIAAAAAAPAAKRGFKAGGGSVATSTAPVATAHNKADADEITALFGVAPATPSPAPAPVPIVPAPAPAPRAQAPVVESQQVEPVPANNSGGAMKLGAAAAAAAAGAPPKKRGFGIKQ